MAYPVVINGDTFNSSDFEGYEYSNNWERFLTAIQFSLTQAGLSQAAAASAAASLANALLITGGSQGIGIEPASLVRNHDLGSAAYFDTMVLKNPVIRSVAANYQVAPADDYELVVGTTGTLTITLPLIADLPQLWSVWIKNRTGNAMTVARNGANINGAAADLTVATGTSVRVMRNGAGFESL